MSRHKSKDDVNQSAISDAAAYDATTGSGNDVNARNRKRRLSKRERKNLKKKQIKSCSSSDGKGDGTENETNETEFASGRAEVQAQTIGVTDNDKGATEKKKEPTLDEYMQNYVPAPTVHIAEGGSNKSKSLGKWFPKASVIKSSICYTNDYLFKLEKQKTTSPNTLTSEPKASLVLFYQYVSPPWSQSKVSALILYLTQLAKSHRTNIGGRIRVSSEGVNATVSAASTESGDGVDPAFQAAQTLRHFAKDLIQFDSVNFSKTDFKYVDNLTADRHFKELKLLPVKELVFYGIREEDCALDPNDAKKSGDGGVEEVDKEERVGRSDVKVVQGGIHLDAKEYHEMLKRKDAVVIDVRNHYEAAIGRFDGQMEEISKEGKNSKCDAGEIATEPSATKSMTAGHLDESGQTKEQVIKGAEYIDPKMRKSTDFPSWLAEPATKEKLEGKTVLMFCTGGIRCERASAYLNSQMSNRVKGVYQLQGGIERYLQAFPEGGFWRGKNFVFDKREAVGAGNVNGDGGVVRHAKHDSKGAVKNEKGGCKFKDGVAGIKEKNSLPRGAECSKCRKPWDRYIGKRKCYTCGVPILLCDLCMSQSSSQKKKKNKKQSTEEVEMVGIKGADKTIDNSGESVDRTRCPLCVEEGITVPAEEVEYTDNGVRGRRRSNSFTEDGCDEDFGNSFVPAAASADTSKSNIGIFNSTTSDTQMKPKEMKAVKAAKSVLKWGGGHAIKKKEKRKFSKRLCQFGSDCVRKDCFFYHPEREKKKQNIK